MSGIDYCCPDCGGSLAECHIGDAACPECGAIVEEPMVDCVPDNRREMEYNKPMSNTISMTDHGFRCNNCGTEYPHARDATDCDQCTITRLTAENAALLELLRGLDYTLDTCADRVTDPDVSRVLRDQRDEIRAAIDGKGE
jgi:hypothetical protein